MRQLPNNEVIDTLVHFTPTKQGRKWITSTTLKHGGLHSIKEFKNGVEMLEHCAHHFRNPRLFHVCLTGASLDTYKLVLKRLCRSLAAAGVEYRYKAALEEDSIKGLHFHVMLVLGTDQQTSRFVTHADESGKLENESLLRKVIRHTWSECPALAYKVNPPRSNGGKVSFLQFNQSNQAFFDEAVDWLSYIYKARSKPASGSVYFSDRQG